MHFSNICISFKSALFDNYMNWRLHLANAFADWQTISCWLPIWQLFIKRTRLVELINHNIFVMIMEITAIVFRGFSWRARSIWCFTCVIVLHNTFGESCYKCGLCIFFSSWYSLLPWVDSSRHSKVHSFFHLKWRMYSGFFNARA